MIDIIDKEERVAAAVAHFKEGFNCTQSVVLAYADIYGYTRKQALRMSAAFGGGIGRMRMTCGAACGLFMLAGIETGSTEGADRARKSACYAEVQKLAERFKQLNGSLICAELLKLSASTPIVSEAEARTEAYYKKRPCAKIIEQAARLFADFLEEQQNTSAEK